MNTGSRYHVTVGHCCDGRALSTEADYNPVLSNRVGSLEFLYLAVSVRAVSWRNLFFATALLSNALLSKALLADAGRSKAELVQLRQQLDTLQLQLADERGREKFVTSELEKLERRLGKLAAERNRKQQELQRVKSNRVELIQQQIRLENQGRKTWQDMTKLVRSSYMLGRQSGLKLILSQQNPVETARSLSFYRYLIKARSRVIDDIKVLQRNLDNTRIELDQQRQQLDRLLKSLGRNREQLDIVRSRREQNLTVIRKRMARNQEQVVLFREREEELKRLLTRLRRQSLEKRSQSGSRSAGSGTKNTSGEIGATIATTGSPTTGSSNKRARSPVREPIRLEGFQQNKGNMNAPVNGRIIARFGQRKPESGLLWEGLMFTAAEGQEVVAIYPGQVVFSDWFGGYGQLIVIDHGDGYMSLYGHNSLTYVKIGAMVKAGQPIGEAGSTGGLARSGLYFEIRYNGDPRDPLEWYRI